MSRLGRDVWRATVVAAVALATGLLIPRAGTAHEAHRKQARPAADTAAAASSAPASPDSIASRGAAGRASGREAPAADSAESPFTMPSMGDMFVHHLHNKIVHLPIVLAPVALALTLLGLRRSGAGSVAPFFTWAAALSGVAAFLSGRAQTEPFEAGPKEWLVATHEKWGIAVMIALLVWAALATWPAARRRAWIVGLVATIGALVAALYGGLVAHG